MKPVSDKRRAERLANGERYIGSSIAPKPLQQKQSGSYCPIRRKTKVKKAKPIAKSNPERQAKVAKRQRKKHAGYMKSETRKTVEARSGGRCEAWLVTMDAYQEIRAIVAKRPDPAAMDKLHPGGLHTLRSLRCENAAKPHHHLTYARYGGDELPEDVVHACKRCHDYFESLKPAGNRFTRNRKG